MQSGSSLDSVWSRSGPRPAPDRLQTASRPLPDRFQNASRPFPDRSAVRKHSGTGLETPGRGLDTIRGRSGALTGLRPCPDHIQTALAPDRVQTASPLLPDQFQNASRPPNGLEAVGKRFGSCLEIVWGRTGSIPCPDRILNVSRLLRDRVQTASRTLPESFRAWGCVR